MVFFSRSAFSPKDSTKLLEQSSWYEALFKASTVNHADRKCWESALWRQSHGGRRVWNGFHCNVRHRREHRRSTWASSPRLRMKTSQHAVLLTTLLWRNKERQLFILFFLFLFFFSIKLFLCKFCWQFRSKHCFHKNIYAIVHKEGWRWRVWNNRDFFLFFFLAPQCSTLLLHWSKQRRGAGARGWATLYLHANIFSQHVHIHACRPLLNTVAVAKAKNQ